jgi:hypothetical protein
MKIGILTMPTPFFFGPYAKQSLVIAEIFIKTHDIYFISNSFTHYEGAEYANLISLDQVKKIEYDEGVYNANKNILDKMKYVSMYGPIKDVLCVSSINNCIDKFNLDKIITLLDLLRIIVNVNTFNCEIISWFPNHYEPIDNSSLYVLRMVSKIVSLSNEGGRVIKDRLPHKIVKTIPHVINIEVPTKPISKIREEYNIPSDKFLVCIVGGNYDINNRRSLDTSIMAFEKFYKQNNKAFLYIQSFTFNGLNFVNDLHRIISYLDIPIDSFIINQTKVEYNKILEIYKMSDICVFGSRSEGFGVPNIEAQLCGASVITNGFGALKDYTYNGICVPYLQQHYDHIADGIWSMPSIQGISDAMMELYKTPLSQTDKDINIKKIKSHMGIDRVGQLFNNILNIETQSQELIEVIIRVKNNTAIDLTQYIKVNIDTYKKIKRNRLIASTHTHYNYKEILGQIRAPLVLMIDMNCNVLDSWLDLLPTICAQEVIKPCIVLKTEYPSENSLTPEEKIFILVESKHLYKMKELNHKNIVKMIVQLGVPIKMTEELVNFYK